MTEVRFPSRKEPGPFELLRFDEANGVAPGLAPSNGWLFRGPGGDVFAIDGDERAEVRCDFCGTFADHVSPTPNDPDLWRCFGGVGPCGSGATLNALR